ncbi:MAG: BamA/TamA family outer membrane protein [Sphingopyxis sp.]
MNSPIKVASLLTAFSLLSCASMAQEVTAQPAQPAQPDQQWLDDIDPGAPLEPLSDLGPDMSVEWPDMGTPLAPLPPLPPDILPPDIETLTAPIAVPDATAIEETVEQSAFEIGDGEHRYSVFLNGLDRITSRRFFDRFALLSVLRQGESQSANGAQINRRIAEDGQLLEALLRSVGYYDASIVHGVSINADALGITFTAQTGPRYTYSSVDIEGLGAAPPDESARIQRIFGIDVGEPIVADTLLKSKAAIYTEMRETGYPFVNVGSELVTIDHDLRQGTLLQPIVPGARLRFGSILARDSGVFGARHIQQIARFQPGEYYRQGDVEDLRRALISTGLVGSLDMTPLANADGSTVDLVVAVAPAPLRTIAAALGYGSGEGLRAEVSWQHRNLFPPEGALTVRGVLGTREQLLGVNFRRNNWRRRDRSLSLQALISNSTVPAFEARTLLLSARIERASTLLFQKIWSWSIEGQLIATDEMAFVRSRNLSLRRRYGIASLGAYVGYDRSNDLLDPTRGFRLSARISPEISFQDKVFSYARVQLDASFYRPIAQRVTLAARVRLGAIAGASLDSIAPSRRLYAGGGSSVRGYGYQAIGPRAPIGDPIGGTGLFEVAAEARVPVWGAFSLVPFVDAGNVYDSGLPSLNDIGDLRVGAGVGVRYASNFGPIRVDVGTPINPRPGDSRISVYVSLGQAF